MLAILADQTAEPNGLTFFEGTLGVTFDLKIRFIF